MPALQGKPWLGASLTYLELHSCHLRADLTALTIPSLQELCLVHCNISGLMALSSCSHLTKVTMSMQQGGLGGDLPAWPHRPPLPRAAGMHLAGCTGHPERCRRGPQLRDCRGSWRAAACCPLRTAEVLLPRCKRLTPGLLLCSRAERIADAKAAAGPDSA